MIDSLDLSCRQTGRGTRKTARVLAGLFFLSSFLAAVAITGCQKPAEVTPAEVKPVQSSPSNVMPPGTSPQVVFLGKPGIDVAGPADAPDAEPDLVIQVDLDQHLLTEIANWEIDANDGLGHWTSVANQNGMWLIKTEIDKDAQLANRDLSRLKLCFKDNGDSRISGFNLMALSADGKTLFQHTVQR